MTPPPGGLEGDAPEVFEALAREHAEMLGVYLRSLVGAGSDLDDLFQETMITAWRKFDDFDRDRAFGAWIRGIARMLVLEHHRLGAARARTLDPAVLQAIDLRFQTLEDAPGETFRDRARRPLDCVARLPGPMRDVIEMAYMRGMSLVEIGQGIGLGVEAVKKRAQRARAALAACMNLEGDSRD